MDANVSIIVVVATMDDVGVEVISRSAVININRQIKVVEDRSGDRARQGLETSEMSNCATARNFDIMHQTVRVKP